ncbi:hypothetical protein ASG60_00035 [Methylobacterium sp. Leaf469]|uniref:hypothetical protein n=1 Tax=Methylobacterium sp. Leaf469 TaxID=1736387 RepID=UPI0006FAAD79|nr:hypothetical protein [Methylobacterium sp. Leaf469]KQU05127.1 hypothetical protein ASG60_00035 [Methylobacterium sp. Leaf469]
MIHLQTSRSSSLQKEIVLSLGLLRYRTRRRYALLVLSCYIDVPAVKRLAERIAAGVNLVEVHLAFELMEAWRGRTPSDLQCELDQLRAGFGPDVRICWSPLRLGSLMHAKAFAVVQVTSDGYGEGLVWIGSGNATRPGLGGGLTNSSMNVELMSLTVEQEGVQAFLGHWQWLLDKATSLDAALRRHDERSFTYGLLASGVYLHKWEGRIGEKVSIRYALTPEGRRRVTVDPTLQAFGADVDQVTISRNPLSTVMETAGQRSLPNGFTRNYAVDTLLGLWCPRDIWAIAEEAVRHSGEFQAFHKGFLTATETDRLEQLVAAEGQAASGMVEQGLIVDQEDRFERWTAKIQLLRNNKGQLERLFLRYDAFELPYDFGSTDELEGVKASLLETLALRARQSFVGTKLREAEAARDLSVLELTADEREDVQDWLAGRPRKTGSDSEAFTF